MFSMLNHYYYVIDYWVKCCHSKAYQEKAKKKNIAKMRIRKIIYLNLKYPYVWLKMKLLQRILIDLLIEFISDE